MGYLNVQEVNIQRLCVAEVSFFVELSEKRMVLSSAFSYQQRIDIGTKKHFLVSHNAVGLRIDASPTTRMVGNLGRAAMSLILLNFALPGGSVK